MDDVASGTQSDLPASNVTQAGITHKVPEWAKPRDQSKTRRPVKLSRHRRRHVRKLKKAGLISERVARSEGL